MDLQAGAIAIAVLCTILAFFTMRGGLRAVRSARKMTFYHLRRQREANGWRQIGAGILLLVFAAAVPLYGLPVAYIYFPPTPTPSLTPTITVVPTITLSPTITLTPTITDTPVVSDTPTASETPHIPAAVVARFSSSVTPNPDVAFSPLQFTTAGSGYPVENPETAFENPVGHLFGVFTYDGMVPGVQWTNLWLREGTLVYADSKPWDGGTGGSGFVDWNPSPEDWLPGVYEVQVFVGELYVVNGRFLVQGDAPTAVPTLTSTITRTPRATASATGTPPSALTASPVVTP